MATLPFAQAFGQTAYTVTRFDDTSVGTLEAGGGFGPGVSGDLRYGLFQAMANGGANSINFACSAAPCTITLQAPLPPIFETNNASSFSLTIDGGTQGNIVLDGNSGGGQANRVFFVDNVAVTLKNLVIQNAVAQGGAGGSGSRNGGGGGAGFGAGLFVNQSTATAVVQNTAFNRCAVIGGAGGVYYNYSASGGGGGGGLAFAGGNGAINSGGGGGGISGAGGDADNQTGGYGGAGGGGGGIPASLDSPGLGGAAYGSNSMGSSGTHAAGGNGGFGGGGGGFSNGGFGASGGFGGGGAGASSNGGLGGFGGGGGSSALGTGGGSAAAVGGVQGGSASSGYAFGGGGAAAGPAIFVVNGSVTLSNTTGSGFSATPGAGGTGAGGTPSASGTADTSPVFNYGGTVNGSTGTGGVQGAVPVGGSSSGTVYGGTPVGQTSAVQTATLWFTAAGAPASINVLTQGAANLDFNATAGGTCSAGTSYQAGQSCTVNFTFAPTHPGLRMGGITLTDGSGNLLANVFISGTGIGPQVTFNGTGTAINTLPITVNSSPAVTVDSSGNVFIPDPAGNDVKELPAGCASSNCVQTLGGLSQPPFGVAVDGAGNVYVASLGASVVEKYPAGCTNSNCVIGLGGGFRNPVSVAVDGSGNVFITDNDFNLVEVIPPTCTSASCVKVLGGNFSNPVGIAVDANGNVYVSDGNNNAIKKMTPGCTNASCVTTLVDSFSQPAGVAVDAGGNVYVSDQGNRAVKEIPAGCTSASCVFTLLTAFPSPSRLALDGAGNLYIPDASHSIVKMIALATPPAVSFITPTVEGATDTTDGPQTVNVANIGNAPLTFLLPTPSIPAGFSQGTESTSCVQLPGMTLGAGSSCTLTTTFAPLVGRTGTISGSIALANNNLNQTNAQQAIPLAGMSVAPTFPNLSLTLASTISLGGSDTFTFTVANPSSTAALSNFNVTLSMPAGLRLVVSRVPVFCSGSVSYTSAGTVTFSGLTLAAGATCQRIYAFVATGPGLQTVSLFASGNGQNGPTVSSSITVGDVPASLQISGTPSSAYVGGSFPFTVTVLDPLGNPDLDYTGTVIFSSSDPQASLPGSATLTSGTGSFMAKLYSVGSQTITATDAANNLVATTNPIPVSIPNLVVTTNQDDAGTASNCTVQAGPGTGTDASCSLRDALAFANATGSGNVTFDNTAFNSSNTVAQNTITEGPAGTLAISSNTTITGPTTGTSVTADGAGKYAVFTVNSGTVSLNALTLTHGTSVDGGGIRQLGGMLTVNACTVTGNSTGADGGGMATLSGSANVINSTFSNNFASSYAGGIYFQGPSMTVIGSTFIGNSTERGGGIALGGTAAMTIVGSTITGNSAVYDGGGVISLTGEGPLTLADNIISGNHTGPYGNNADLSFHIPATLIDNGGNVIGSSAINLSALSNYGGSTQTVLPLPGSSAICAGTLANAQAAGVTTDQRGFVFNPACPAGSVDSGAVQTNYVLRFTADPPATTLPGTAMAPAPAVTVTESGVVLAAGSATVNVTDRASDLTASPATAGTTAGIATFGNLLFTGAATGDTLTATLPLNANVNVTTASKAFNVTPVTPVISFTPASNSQIYGPAITSATLNATATANGSPVAGTFAYTTTIGGAANQPVTAGGTVLPGAGPGQVGTYTITATFTPANASLYASASATAGYSVYLAPTVLTWPTPAAITYGTPLSGTQLNATASVAGNFSYTPSSGLLGAGSQTLSVLFTPQDTTNYTTASASVPLVVNKATPTVTWNTPAAITYGTTLSSTQLNATASVQGSFSYTPSSGVLGAGQQMLSVLFTPTDSTDYSSVTKTVTLVVNKATPVVTWNTPAAITYGTALSSTQLNATATVAGSFSYTPSSGLLGAGQQTLSVLFTPTDSTNYNSVTQTVTQVVSQATPVVTWATPAAITYGTALSSSQLNATASVPGSFQYTPSSGVLGAGSQTLSVKFTPTDTTDYVSVTQTVTQVVNQATPVVNWSNPAAITYGTALSSTQLNATASVPGSFQYTPSSGVLGAGSQTLSVKFTPTDATDYSSVTKTVTLVVNQAAPVVSWNAPAAITYGTALSSTQLNATASVQGSFQYTPSSGVLGAGSQTLSVKFTPTDATDYSSVTKTVTLVVNQAAPVVSWNAPAAITYGTALSSTQLNATASVQGSFQYTPSSGVLGAGSQTLSVKFTPTDATDYSSVTKTVTLVVNQAAPVVSWNAPAAITYGTALSSTQLNATASVQGSFSYSPSSGVLGAGSQTLSVTFTPQDSTDYSSVTKTVTLVVNQAAPVVSWNAPAAITYGTALSSTQLNATASVQGSFSYSLSSGVLGAGQQTLSVKFTPTDSTDYVPVTKTVTLVVNPATPVVGWNTPAAITYGTSLSSTQLNATASVQGSFSYSPSSGLLGVGQQTLSVTFTPTDSTDYSSVTKTVTLVVNPATPVVGWNTPAAITYGTSLSSTQLNATASVQGSFSYSPSSGVRGAGQQTLSVTFTPTDSTDYVSVTKMVALVVNKANTTINAAITTTQTVTGTTATITATVKPQIGGTPTGTITYLNGSTTLGSAPVGTPFTTPVLSVGTDQLTAVYSGDSNFTGSTSSPTAVVSLAPSIVQLYPALNRLIYPLSQVTYTVTVPLKNLQLMTGTITLYDGSIAIGTYTISPLGTFVGITPTLSIGTHSLRAVYNGDSHYTPGQSPVITITVFTI